MTDRPPLENADREIDAAYSDQPPASETAHCQSPKPPPATGTDWVEFVLVTGESKPVAGEAYRLTLPDGRVLEGKLDDAGKVRVENIASGQCTIDFPNIEQSATAPTTQPE